MLHRVADLFDQYADDPHLQATDGREQRASNAVAGASEAARATREMLPSIMEGTHVYDGANHVRQQLERCLPLNRNERFYTATVLPMLLASDAFAQLGSFIELCGLRGVELPPPRRDGTAPCQLLTEYSFAMSLYGSIDRRWRDHQRRRDTPDLVIVGDDASWIVAIEAKVYDRPARPALERQVRSQHVHLDEWATVLGVPPECAVQVVVLPEGHVREVGHVEGATTVTWERIADEFRPVGPAYWVGVLDVAMEHWPLLASRSGGSNADAVLTGEQIQDLFESGLLEYGYMGRRGGLGGELLRTDVEDGSWRDQSYEVRREPLANNPNWFPVEDFLDGLDQGLS